MSEIKWCRACGHIDTYHNFSWGSSTDGGCLVCRLKSKSFEEAKHEFVPNENLAYIEYLYEKKHNVSA